MKINKTALALTILLAFTFNSCSKNSAKKIEPKILGETKTHVNYIGYSGKKMSVKKKPKRVILLMNSYLDLWYFAGGKAIARVQGKINIPKEAQNLEIVGLLGNPNIEKIVSMNPDLVVLNKKLKKHKDLPAILKSSGIETIEIKYANYKDFLFISELFMRINDNHKALAKIKKIKDEIQAIIDRCPDKNNPLVLITFASANNVSSELPNGDTGLMLTMLKGRNITANSPIKGGTRVDLSIETITSMDPDIMLIKMMGKQDRVQARLDKYYKANSSLQGIKAIKDDKLYYLPRNLFMYKPNAKYPEAFRYLAAILYPEVFKMKIKKK